MAVLREAIQPEKSFAEIFDSISEDEVHTGSTVGSGGVRETVMKSLVKAKARCHRGAPAV
jgi:hypothetical protein